MVKEFKAQPDDNYITISWGQYPGDRNKGTMILNQRGLEQMPAYKRKKLFRLIEKAQRG